MKKYKLAAKIIFELLLLLLAVIMVIAGTPPNINKL